MSVGELNRMVTIYQKNVAHLTGLTYRQIRLYWVKDERFMQPLTCIANSPPPSLGYAS